MSMQDLAMLIESKEVEALPQELQEFANDYEIQCAFFNEKKDF